MTEPDDLDHRARIVGYAEGWLGTPYRHQASAEGVGTDCLGLIRGVWRQLYGQEPETTPPYTQSWSRAEVGEPMLDAALRHFETREGQPLLPGDVLVFRMIRDGPAKHCGIYLGGDRFIHAYAGKRVVSSWLSAWWHQRIAGVFAYPLPEETTI